MKVQQNDRRLFNIFRLCFLVLLILSAVGTAIYCTVNPQLESWASDVIYLENLHVKDPDGNEITVIANQRYAYDENGILEVNGTLTDRVRDVDYI